MERPQTPAEPAVSRPYRVVQWATGNIGIRSLRAVIEHRDLTLAGVYVHAADKAGRDAGELCGLDPVGVTTTRDIEEILELGADCVLYMPRACDFDEVCRLLAAGVNVVTTRGEFHRAASMDSAVRERVEAACGQGGASVHSTGINPGFISEAIPLALTSIQRRLDNLTISEFANVSQRDSPEMLFDVMGFGRAPSEFDRHRFTHLRHSFGPSLHLLADALGRPLDSVEVNGEFATARHAVHIAAGTLEEGTVAAQRVNVSGMHSGRPLLNFSATWYCSTDLEPGWDVRPTGWHIALDGDAPLDIDMRLAVPLERMGETAPSYTANRAVNAVPVVCAASPGIRSTLDLPQVISTLA